MNQLFQYCISTYAALLLYLLDYFPTDGERTLNNCQAAQYIKNCGANLLSFVNTDCIGREQFYCLFLIWNNAAEETKLVTSETIFLNPVRSFTLIDANQEDESNDNALIILLKGKSNAFEVIRFFSLGEVINAVRCDWNF